MILYDAARVLDGVPAARAALEGDAAQARVHGEVHAVEFVVGAAHVVGERQEVIGQPVLFLALDSLVDGLG
jgi:hypothetical protein